MLFKVVREFEVGAHRRLKTTTTTLKEITIHKQESLANANVKHATAVHV